MSFTARWVCRAVVLTVLAWSSVVSVGSQVETEEAVQPPAFALADPGPYATGTRNYTFVDTSRNNRQVRVTMWYPAVVATDETGRSLRRNAPLDTSGAPYPLVLTGTNSGTYLFKSHLASYGFVMAIVEFGDSPDEWGPQLLNDPRDVLFALDQIAAGPLDGLDGGIDAGNAAVIGYSFDGYVALAVSGARIDPGFYRDKCSNLSTAEPALDSFLAGYYCNLSRSWDEFVALAGDSLTSSDDGLWQPLTDERIRAVIPMAPEGAWLFGDRGLAAVDRPTLIVGATEDTINLYRMEAVHIFEHLGTPNRAMISFVGKGHFMVLEGEAAARMRHFATAFLGYYLQGRLDYAQYFSEDFVSQFDDLAWGVYPAN
jgi:predicted dienelactone hydrolase